MSLTSSTSDTRTRKIDVTTLPVAARPTPSVPPPAFIP